LSGNDTPPGFTPVPLTAETEVRLRATVLLAAAEDGDTVEDADKFFDAILEACRLGLVVLLERDRTLFVHRAGAV
jgi:hypothetical protein